MDFLNTILLFCLAGILLPIIIHLFNRSASKPIDWGAMRFLRESVANRSRRIRLEDALLLACRCLLVALFALALARPFSVAGAPVPWLFVLPLALLGIALLGSAFAIWRSASWATALMLLGIVCLVLCGLLVVMEKKLQLRRFGGGGATDIGIVIDGSTSMNRLVEGQTNFARAIEEAKEFVKESGADNSFSLVLAGPVPRVITPSPTQGRDALLVLLDEIQPSGSVAEMLSALEAATKLVQRGDRQQKQIVVFTDGQDRGWHLENNGRWLNLQTRLEDQTIQPPKVVIRTLETSKDLLNASATDIRLARDIVGTDRPVTIEATVQNTGNEDLPPTEVSLRVDNEVLTPATTGALSPGQEETVRFMHKFDHPGPHRVAIKLEREDELPEDDELEKVITIAGNLPVLLVNGKPALNVMERASTFARFALAPESGTEAGQQHLVDPTVIEVANLASVRSFQKYAAVVLCNVPRLPADVAERLVDFVEQGGGLLIAPGDRAFPEFYNDWRYRGDPVLPTTLVERRPSIPDESPLTPDLESCKTPALRNVASERKSDFADASLNQGWMLAENKTVQGRWNDGSPFLCGHNLGEGMIMMLSNGLTPDDSTLPTRLIFVPFLHELVYHLAQPGNIQLHLPPEPQLVMPLNKGATQHGLWMELKALGDDATRFAATAPGINFNFDLDPIPGIPEDLFTAQWTGELHPPISGTYTFLARCDDEFVLQLGGKTVLSRDNPGQAQGEILLIQGQPVPLEARFEEDDGLAFIDLQWIVPGDEIARIPPASAFRPAQSGKGGKTVDNLLADVPLSGPDPGAGPSSRNLQILHGPDGLKAKLDEDIMPGTYSATIPPVLQEELAHTTLPDGTFMFSVEADNTESNWKALNQLEFDTATKSLNIQRASNVDEILAMLSGTVYGKELWKILAIAALFLLLGEVALTRWISQNRTPDPTPIRFEEPGKTRPEFRDTLEQIKALR